jgi:hypothetical protein
MNTPTKTPAIEVGPLDIDPDGWCFQFDPPGEAKSPEEHQRDLAAIRRNFERHRHVRPSSEIPGNMLAAALDYAGRGWAVFPVHSATAGRCSCGNPACGSPGKHPRTPNGLKAAAKGGPEHIRAWWNPDRWPTANVAIATGETSGFFVLDIDPRHSGDEALRELERQHGELPATVRSLTGGNGQHILFRHVPGFGNSAGKVGPGLDIKTDGGYVVAPPSMHISGRRYAWSVDHHPDDVPIAEAPAWLVSLATTGGAAPKCTPPEASSPERWIEALSQEHPEGERKRTLTRLVGHLLRRGVDPYVVLEVAKIWDHARCKPPLDTTEVTRVVNSICLREAQRREAS